MTFYQHDHVFCRLYFFLMPISLLLNSLKCIKYSWPLSLYRFSSPQIEIRALVEGQMLHHRAVAEDLGYKFGPETQILVTGGASVNKSILQTIADVFNAPVHIQVSSYQLFLKCKQFKQHVSCRMKDLRLPYWEPLIDPPTLCTFKRQVMGWRLSVTEIIS